MKPPPTKNHLKKGVERPTEGDMFGPLEFRRQCSPGQEAAREYQVIVGPIIRLIIVIIIVIINYQYYYITILYILLL